MFKRILVLSLISLFVISVVGSAGAFGISLSHLSGTVKGIDKETNMIVIEKKAEAGVTEFKLIVSTKTKFENIDSINELAPGDKVDVAYKVSKGKNEAISIAKKG